MGSTSRALLQRLVNLRRAPVLSGYQKRRWVGERWSAQDYVLKRFSAPPPLQRQDINTAGHRAHAHTQTHTHTVYQHKDQLWIYLTIALVDQKQSQCNIQSSQRGHKKGMKHDCLLKYGQAKSSFGKRQSINYYDYEYYQVAQAVGNNLRHKDKSCYKLETCRTISSRKASNSTKKLNIQFRTTENESSTITIIKYSLIM